jgi:hypothetical protein
MKPLSDFNGPRGASPPDVRRRRHTEPLIQTLSDLRSRSPVRTSGGGAPVRSSSIGAPPVAVTRSSSARTSSTGAAPGAITRSPSGGWPNANHYAHSSRTRAEQRTKKMARHSPLGLTRSSSAENAFELFLWKKHSGLMQSRLLYAVKQRTVHATNRPVVESDEDAPASRGLSQACTPKSASLPGRLSPHELQFAHEVSRKLQTAYTVKCTRQASNCQHPVAQHAFNCKPSREQVKIIVKEDESFRLMMWTHNVMYPGIGVLFEIFRTLFRLIGTREFHEIS